MALVSQVSIVPKEALKEISINVVISLSIAQKDLILPILHHNLTTLQKVFNHVIKV